MKLKNKKTGEILDFKRIRDVEFGHKILLQVIEYHDKPIYIYTSLAELNEEWEDYEEPKDYWYISPIGKVHLSNDSLEGTKESKEIGNYFSSIEEAKKAVEKLRAWKRLKDSGFRFNGGDDACISYRIDSAKWNDKLDNDFDLLFGGEE